MADNGSASQELLCIEDEGPEDFYYVPFPTVSSKTVVLRWKKELQDYFSEDFHFILKHPDSDVGIECLRGGFYSEFNDPALLYVDVYPFYRVDILSSRVDDAGLTFAKCEAFTEEKVSRETFQGRAFKEKITRLSELAVEFLIILNDSGGSMLVRVLDLNIITENEAGSIVDFYANWLNEIIYEEGVKDSLVSILEEKNVKKRMDKAIALYEWSLREERNWIKDLQLQNQDSESVPILPVGTTGEEQPVSSEDTPTVSQLLHHRIFEIGPEEQFPEVPLSGGENGSSKPDDPNSRENLIQRRIYRKGGDENADSTV